jgi:NADH:ubiquinone oxidoreductase subunit B-like Fe-S oxidoreductase
MRQFYVKIRTNVEPRWVIAVGACALQRYFDTYSVLQGIDKGIPVEFMYRCPPRPEQIVRV